jgi:hypothetical protein
MFIGGPSGMNTATVKILPTRLIITTEQNDRLPASGFMKNDETGCYYHIIGPGTCRF